MMAHSRQMFDSTWKCYNCRKRLTWFSDYDVVTISVTDKPTVVLEEGYCWGGCWIGDKPQLDVLILTSSYSMEPLRQQ